MDANAVVHELVHHRIIMGGDRTTIMKTPDTTQQNEYLHMCLLRTCDEEALMAVCDIIVQRGYPTMRTLGQDMKSRLDGKYWVCVCVFIHALHACASYVFA